MKLFALALLALLGAPSAHANLPALRKTGIGLESFSRGTDEYRLGDEWGKKAVTASTLAHATPAFQRGAEATAHVQGATAFYLGKFNGVHVMATNHHVYGQAEECIGNSVDFPLLHVRGTCQQFLGSWADIDLALFTIEVDPSDEAKLAAVASNFQFTADPQYGEKLLTIGFGVAGNWSGNLMANQDNDCYVFSRTGEYQQMGDPDTLNPGDYRAWSFALGCDVSHGDSGSAILDRDSGKVIGIIWTGKTPKDSFVQSSANLTKMFQDHDPGIWTELSYAVPAKKMGEYLNGLLQNGNGQMDSFTHDTLEAVLK